MGIFKIVTLSLSGLLLLLVGAMRLSNPIKTFLKSSGISLANDVNLLNELRGLSAVMFFAGIIILLGLIVPVLTISSFVIATLMFIGFAVGRIVSISADGKPNKQILQGIVFELVLGIASIFCLFNVLG